MGVDTEIAYAFGHMVRKCDGYAYDVEKADPLYSVVGYLHPNLDVSDTRRPGTSSIINSCMDGH